MARWIALAIGSLLIGHGHLTLSALIFGGGVIAFYLVSLQLHPNRTCRACGGTGRHRGAMFTWSHRPCSACGGQSRHRRWGTQALHGSPGQRTRAEQAAQDAGKRRGAPR